MIQVSSWVMLLRGSAKCQPAVSQEIMSCWEEEGDRDRDGGQRGRREGPGQTQHVRPTVGICSTDTY